MKYSKRIISLVLALTMICAMAISVSAATYTWNGNYNGYSVEVSDSCTISRFSSTLISDAPDNLQITARVYGWSAKINSDGTFDILDADDRVYADLESEPSMTVTRLSRVEPYATIYQIRFTYTVGVSTVHQHYISA